MLSEEVRQRIQAAVKAERAGAATQDRQGTTESAKRATASPAAVTDLFVPTANGTSAPHRPGHAAKPERAVKPDRAPTAKAKAEAKPAPAAKPERAVKPDHAAKPAPAAKPALPEPTRRRPAKIRLVALALVLVAVASLATVVSLHVANSSRGNGGLSPAVLRHQEALTRSQAASWVTSQVNPDNVVACDQAMYRALRADGYPASKLVTLGPQSPAPMTSAVVVVVTEAVRDLFGTSIDAAWAPAVLTSMGSGAAEVSVRLIAAHGALAYQDQLTAGLAARAGFGKGLLDDSRIELSATAHQQLASGQVDERLVVAIASLAGAEPISILGFGNVGSGASAGVPLRYADLATADSAAHLGGAAYLRAMQTRLSQVDNPYRPTSNQTVGHVFRVAFTGPSPLGSVSGP